MTSAASDGEARIPLDPDVDFRTSSEVEGYRRRRRARQVQAIIVMAVACGGVFGAVSRYALALAIPTGTRQFPWSTLLINICGSLALGFILIIVIEQFPRGRLARSVIGTGFIGAFTTFSTFEVDAAELIRDGRPDLALIYIAASLSGGLVAVWVGMSGARVVLRAERWLQEEV